MPGTFYGYFLIADITGYTSYLNASELDHAQQALSALLNLLIRSTRPPLVISRLAGDAVISYGLRETFLQGQTLVELIEETYVAYRRAIDLMVLNTTCTCNACKNINSLDLKFFVHYGEFGIQKLDAHDELVGADVIVIHRLLKNSVSEKTGIKAYAMYTDAAIEQLSLREICSIMVPHVEVHEHLGEVKVWIQDMHPVWMEKRNQALAGIPPEQVLLQPSATIRASPEQIWDYLIQGEHFAVLLTATKSTITDRKDGRVREGSVYQCYHGEKVHPLTILVWKPFERILVHSSAPMGLRGVSLLTEVRLEPVEEGTRLFQLFGKASGPWLGRMICDVAIRMMLKSAQRDVVNFVAHVENDLAQRASNL